MKTKKRRCCCAKIIWLHSAHPLERLTLSESKILLFANIYALHHRVIRYKCPKCRDVYCSVACCKTHKESCAAAAEHKISPITQQPISSAVPFSKYIPRGELIRDPLKGNRRRRQLASLPSEQDEEEEEGWRLTQEMMTLIDESVWLRGELSDGGLRQIIDEIDDAASANYRNAESAAHDRERALENAKQRYPHFSAFIDELLLLTKVISEDGNGCVVLNPLEKKKREGEDDATEKMDNDDNQLLSSSDSESSDSDSVSTNDVSD